MGKKSMKSKLLAALLAMGIAGSASTAFATAYAISYDNIFNGTVSASDPTQVFPLQVGVTTSGDGSSLNGNSGPSNSDVGVGTRDASVSNAPLSNPLQVNNAFTALGQVGTYSWGDAWVPSVQDGVPGSTIHAINAAESYLGSLSGSAESRGNNTSATTLQAIIDITSPDTVVFFDFFASPYMKVLLGPDALLGSKAEAILEMSVVLTSNTTGLPVFDWHPDGVVGTGLTGGTENVDDYSLNTTRTQLLPGQLVYDPTGIGAANALGDFIPTLFGHYNAQTNLLPTGLYTLTLNGAERESTINVAAPIPEPGTFLLLGAGLVGLTAVYRRRRS